MHPSVVLLTFAVASIYSYTIATYPQNHRRYDQNIEQYMSQMRGLLSYIPGSQYSDKVRFVFDMYDGNHDGVITAREVVNFSNMGGTGLSDDFATHLIQRFDKNRDNVINFNEMMNIPYS
ncbi:hypothetical protein ACOME3_009782 [Neoechinorhynchus agilis]